MQFDFIISHRLHSSIIARSIGVGSIGLIWDKKVESFYESIDAKEYSLRGDAIDEKKILCLIEKYKFDNGMEKNIENIAELKSVINDNLNKMDGEY